MTVNSSTDSQAPPSGYLVVDENRLAYAAVCALSHPRHKVSGSLVYIYGPSGVGKSHLVRYILQQWLREDSDFTYQQVTARQFDADVLDAVAKRTLYSFARHYQQLDLLICDDIHALEQKPQAQWQLLYSIDRILSGNGHVLLTAQNSPGQLSGMHPRLLNRFHGGCCVGISLPTQRSRVRFLLAFASSRQLALPLDVAQLVARSFLTSPRELFGYLLRLDAVSRATGHRVDCALAARVLQQCQPPVHVSTRLIAKAVARQVDISLQDIRSHSRARKVVLPRQLAIFLSRDLADDSYGQIARFFRFNNHSSAIHAYNRVRQQLTINPELRCQLSLIRTSLGIHTSQRCL